MGTSPKTMEEEYARSPVGEVCEMPQIEIGDRTFSLIASACYLELHFPQSNEKMNRRLLIFE